MHHAKKLKNANSNALYKSKALAKLGLSEQFGEPSAENELNRSAVHFELLNQRCNSEILKSKLFVERSCPLKNQPNKIESNRKQ